MGVLGNDTVYGDGHALVDQVAEAGKAGFYPVKQLSHGCGLYLERPQTAG